MIRATHYTSNTGHALPRVASDVFPETFAILRPLVAHALASHEPVELPRSGMTFEIRIVEGVPFVTLGRGSWPLTLTVCCLSEGQHAAALEVLSSTLKGIDDAFPTGDKREPEPGEWLYSVVLPIGTPEDLRTAGEVVFYIYCAIHQHLTP